MPFHRHAEGRLVSTADNLISFELTSSGKIIGVSNGEPSSHEPDQFLATEKTLSPVWQRSLFNGLVQVIVQPRRTLADRACRRDHAGDGGFAGQSWSAATVRAVIPAGWL